MLHCCSTWLSQVAAQAWIERREAQEGTRQARVMAADADAWNARPTQRHRALREGRRELLR